MPEATNYSGPKARRGITPGPDEQIIYMFGTGPGTPLGDGRVVATNSDESFGSASEDSSTVRLADAVTLRDEEEAANQDVEMAVARWEIVDLTPVEPARVLRSYDDLVINVAHILDNGTCESDQNQEMTDADHASETYASSGGGGDFQDVPPRGPPGNNDDSVENAASLASSPPGRKRKRSLESDVINEVTKRPAIRSGDLQPAAGQARQNLYGGRMPMQGLEGLMPQPRAFSNIRRWPWQGPHPDEPSKSYVVELDY